MYEVVHRFNLMSTTLMGKDEVEIVNMRDMLMFKRILNELGVVYVKTQYSRKCKKRK